MVTIAHDEGDALEPRLRYAQRDAERFAAVLTQLGGVPAHRVIALQGIDADHVRAALADVHRRLEADPGARTDRGLIVYFSGHADAKALHLGGTHLPYDDLRAAVSEAPAGVRLLVVDACRSGAISRVKGTRRAPAFEITYQARESAEGMAVLTSSAAGEESQESDELGASVFSHHLVNGLLGAADRDGDRQVTLDEAYAYSYAQTVRSSGQTVALQHPTFDLAVKGRGGVVLTRLAPDGRHGELQLAEPTVYLITVDRDDGALIAEVSPEKPGARLVLPAGQYRVQARQTREYRDYRVNLPPGGRADLRALPHRSVRYGRLVRTRGSTVRVAHSLMLLGGGRGELLDGEGATPQLLLVYGLDLPWFTLEARARGSRISTNGLDGRSPRTHTEGALGLAFHRFVDFSAFSLAFGLYLEGAFNQQTFTGPRDIDDRRYASFGMGGLFSVERILSDGLALRVEGGPMSVLYEQATTELGAESGSELASPLVWWAAAGLRYSF
ncbi:MAG: caspase family protein [Myxococcales bacterium]|nr:caspase family protein [Myxococcales bacterium]